MSPPVWDTFVASAMFEPRTKSQSWFELQPLAGICGMSVLPPRMNARESILNGGSGGVGSDGSDGGGGGGGGEGRLGHPFPLVSKTDGNVANATIASAAIFIARFFEAGLAVWRVERFVEVDSFAIIFVVVMV